MCLFLEDGGWALLGKWLTCILPEATAKFKTDHEAMLSLCPACSWSISWYKLEETLRLVHPWLPGQVTVIALPHRAGLTAIWPVQRKPRKRATRAVAQRRREPVSVAAEIGGDDGQSGGETEEDEALVPFVVGDELEESPNLSLFLRAESMGPLEGGRLDPSGSAAAASSSSAQPERADRAAAPTAIAGDMIEGAEGRAGDAVADDHGEVAVPKAKAVPRGPLHQAAAAINVEGGRIAFHFSKLSFEATCSAHPRCVISRTCAGRTSRKREGALGGRPVGFLCCWLQTGSQYASKAEHMNKENWTFSQADRSTARLALRARPAGPDILSHERELTPGEPEEPETLAGML